MPTCGWCPTAGGAAARDPLPRRDRPQDRHRRLRSPGCCSAPFGLASNTVSLGIAAERPAGQARGARSCAARRARRLAGRTALREPVAVAAQQPFGRDGDGSPRRLFQRPMADGGPQPARAQISRRSGRFASDPSELVRPNACPDGLHLHDRPESLASLPRDGFDYVWLIDTPPHNPALVAGMQPVWRGRGSILYRLHP